MEAPKKRKPIGDNDDRSSMADDENESLILENAVLQCKDIFETILRVQTNALPKITTFDTIFKTLQKYLSKVSESNVKKNAIRPKAKTEDCNERKSNLKVFDSFESLCNEKNVQIPNIYECAECRYQTYRKGDLKKHLKRHMGILNYSCNYCGRKFFDKFNLERHVNANHTKKNPHSCLKCPYTTFTSESFKRHNLLKHSDGSELQKYICYICNHISGTKYDMTIHLATHNNNKPFMCEECGKVFALKSRLQTHQNTVHAERKYKCLHCDKDFKSLLLLKRHAIVHTRIKPYSCPFCNHSSNNQGNLTSHVRIVHSKPNFSYYKFISGKPQTPDSAELTNTNQIFTMIH